MRSVMPIAILKEGECNKPLTRRIRNSVRMKSSAVNVALSAATKTS
jgi:hypothetical protein